MMYGYDYGFYPFHIFGAVFMAIFWIFFVMLIIRLLRGGRHHGFHGWHGWDGGTSHSHPVDILKERYAKGEITKEKFEEMKKDVE